MTTDRVSASAEDPLVIRPRKVRLIVTPVAAVVVVVAAVAAVLLKSGSTGVRFGLSDRVAVALIGLSLAAVAVALARPRVRADAEGVEVRNVFFGRWLSWTEIRGVSFPDGSPWARLDLDHDEYVPVVAIQAADGERAVRAMRDLRARYRAAIHSDGSE